MWSQASKFEAPTMARTMSARKMSLSSAARFARNERTDGGTNDDEEEPGPTNHQYKQEVRREARNSPRNRLSVSAERLECYGGPELAPTSLSWVSWGCGTHSGKNCRCWAGEEVRFSSLPIAPSVQDSRYCSQQCSARGSRGGRTRSPSWGRGERRAVLQVLWRRRRPSKSSCSRKWSSWQRLGRAR